MEPVHVLAPMPVPTTPAPPAAAAPASPESSPASTPLAPHPDEPASSPAGPAAAAQVGEGDGASPPPPPPRPSPPHLHVDDPSPAHPEVAATSTTSSSTTSDQLLSHVLTSLTTSTTTTMTPASTSTRTLVLARDALTHYLDDLTNAQQQQQQQPHATPTPLLLDVLRAVHAAVLRSLLHRDRDDSLATLLLSLAHAHRTDRTVLACVVPTCAALAGLPIASSLPRHLTHQHHQHHHHTRSSSPTSLAGVPPLPPVASPTSPTTASPRLPPLSPRRAAALAAASADSDSSIATTTAAAAADKISDVSLSHTRLPSVDRSPSTPSPHSFPSTTWHALRTLLLSATTSPAATTTSAPAFASSLPLAHRQELVLAVDQLVPEWSVAQLPPPHPHQRSTLTDQSELKRVTSLQRTTSLASAAASSFARLPSLTHPTSLDPLSSSSSSATSSSSTSSSALSTAPAATMMTSVAVPSTSSPTHGPQPSPSSHRMGTPMSPQTRSRLPPLSIAVPPSLSAVVQASSPRTRMTLEAAASTASALAPTVAPVPVPTTVASTAISPPLASTTSTTANTTASTTTVNSASSATASSTTSADATSGALTVLVQASSDAPITIQRVDSSVVSPRSQTDAVASSLHSRKLPRANSANSALSASSAAPFSSHSKAGSANHSAQGSPDSTPLHSPNESQTSRSQSRMRRRVSPLVVACTNEIHSTASIEQLEALLPQARRSERTLFHWLERAHQLVVGARALYSVPVASSAAAAAAAVAAALASPSISMSSATRFNFTSGNRVASGGAAAAANIVSPVPTRGTAGVIAAMAAATAATAAPTTTTTTTAAASAAAAMILPGAVPTTSSVSSPSTSSPVTSGTSATSPRKTPTSTTRALTSAVVPTDPRLYMEHALNNTYAILFLEMSLSSTLGQSDTFPISPALSPPPSPLSPASSSAAWRSALHHLCGILSALCSQYVVRYGARSVGVVRQEGAINAYVELFRRYAYAHDPTTALALLHMLPFFRFDASQASLFADVLRFVRSNRNDVECERSTYSALRVLLSCPSVSSTAPLPPALAAITLKQLPPSRASSPVAGHSANGEVAANDGVVSSDAAAPSSSDAQAADENALRVRELRELDELVTNMCITHGLIVMLTSTLSASLPMFALVEAGDASAPKGAAEAAATSNNSSGSRPTTAGSGAATASGAATLAPTLDTARSFRSVDLPRVFDAFSILAHCLAYPGISAAALQDAMDSLLVETACEWLSVALTATVDELSAHELADDQRTYPWSSLSPRDPLPPTTTATATTATTATTSTAGALSSSASAPQFAATQSCRHGGLSSVPSSARSTPNGHASSPLLYGTGAATTTTTSTTATATAAGSNATAIKQGNLIVSACAPTETTLRASESNVSAIDPDLSLRVPSANGFVPSATGQPSSNHGATSAASTPGATLNALAEGGDRPNSAAATHGTAAAANGAAAAAVTTAATNATPALATHASTDSNGHSESPRSLAFVHGRTNSLGHELLRASSASSSTAAPLSSATTATTTTATTTNATATSSATSNAPLAAPAGHVRMPSGASMGGGGGGGLASSRATHMKRIVAAAHPSLSSNPLADVQGATTAVAGPAHRLHSQQQQQQQQQPQQQQQLQQHHRQPSSALDHATSNGSGGGGGSRGAEIRLALSVLSMGVLARMCTTQQFAQRFLESNGFEMVCRALNALPTLADASFVDMCDLIECVMDSNRASREVLARAKHQVHVLTAGGTGGGDAMAAGYRKTNGTRSKNASSNTRRQQQYQQQHQQQQQFARRIVMPRFGSRGRNSSSDLGDDEDYDDSDYEESAGGVGGDGGGGLHPLHHHAVLEQHMDALHRAQADADALTLTDADRSALALALRVRARSLDEDTPLRSRMFLLAHRLASSDEDRDEIEVSIRAPPGYTHLRVNTDPQVETSCCTLM